MSSIAQAEQLKSELTDKWVVVAEEVPELRRFESLTGKVKTVNMNCRALVEFHGGEDISWYDIDPQFLTVVDGPQKKDPKPAAEEKPSAKSAPKAAPAAGGNPLDQIRAGGAPKPAPTTGGSPLDQIRSGGASKPAAPKAGGSPLDQIRAGGAAPAKAKEPEVQDEKPAEPEAKKESAAAPPTGGSPLDMIRSQGGFKG